MFSKYKSFDFFYILHMFVTFLTCCRILKHHMWRMTWHAKTCHDMYWYDMTWREYFPEVRMFPGSEDIQLEVSLAKWGYVAEMKIFRWQFKLGRWWYSAGNFSVGEHIQVANSLRWWGFFSRWRYPAGSVCAGGEDIQAANTLSSGVADTQVVVSIWGVIICM